MFIDAYSSAFHLSISFLHSEYLIPRCRSTLAIRGPKTLALLARGIIHPSLPSTRGQSVLSSHLTQHLYLLPLLPITYMKRMTYLHLGTRLSREVYILILQTIIWGQSCKGIRGQWLSMTVEAINLNHLCNIRVNKENVVHSLLTYFSLPHSSIMDEEDEAA